MAKIPSDDGSMLLWPELSLEFVEARDDEILKNFDLTTSSESAVGRRTDGGQLLNSHEVKAFRKPVAAIHAMPIEKDFSLNQSRLFDALIAVVQKTAKQQGETTMRRIIEERQSPIYTVHAAELSRIAGIPGNAFQRIYRDLDHLLQTTLCWNMVGEDDSVLFEMKSNLLSTLGVGRYSATGKIAFAMPPEVLAIALNPKIWADMSFEVLRRLPTIASYHLYGRAFRYSKNPGGVTAALPLSMWVEWLAPNTRFLKTDERGEKIALNYPDFKRRILMPAIKVINNLDLVSHRLELKEITAGRKVVKLQFAFKKKEEQQCLPDGPLAELAAELVKLGVSESDAKQMLDAYEKEQIQEAINRFSASQAKAASQDRRILSPKAYLKGILDNVVKEEGNLKLKAEEDERKRKEEDLQRRQRQAADLLQRLNSDFQNHQANAFRKNYLDLPQEAQDDLAGDFLRSAEGAPIQALIERGMSRTSPAVMIGIKNWSKTERPEMYERLLPEPQDQEQQIWAAWRLSNAHSK